MKLLIALPLLGLALAQSYGGGDTGPAYPPAQGPVNPSYSPVQPGYLPQYGHHGHHRSRSSSSSESSSRSRSHSREHNKCNRCKKLKKYDGEGFKKVTIKDLKCKDRCDRVVVSCPFDNDNYALYGINGPTDSQKLSHGQYIQRVVKCNKKGRWQADAIEKDDYTFKYVGCQINRERLTLAATNATSEINVVDPPLFDLN